MNSHKQEMLCFACLLVINYIEIQGRLKMFFTAIVKKSSEALTDEFSQNTINSFSGVVQRRRFLKI